MTVQEIIDKLETVPTKDRDVEVTLAYGEYSSYRVDVSEGSVDIG